MAYTFDQIDEFYSERKARSRTHVKGVKAVRLPGTATTLRPLPGPAEYPLLPLGCSRPYAYAVRYQDTDVVILYRDGSVRLDNGGWPTVTTVRKMKEYTPGWVRVQGRDITARRSGAHPRIEFDALTGCGHLDVDHNTVTLPANPYASED